MDDTKSNSVGSSSDTFVNERTDNEGFEKKDEKQLSPVTLHEKEIIEKNENSHLLLQEAEPEVLESVQRYATRIKSFLGWEQSLEDYGKDGPTALTPLVNDAKDLDSGVGENKENFIEISPENESEVEDNFENQNDVINNNDLINVLPEYESASPDELRTKDTSVQEVPRTKAILEKSSNMADLTNSTPDCDRNFTGNSESILQSDDIHKSKNDNYENSGEDNDIPVSREITDIVASKEDINEKDTQLEGLPVSKSHPPESSTNNEARHKQESIDEDLKSNHSLNLDECIPLRNNVHEPYMDEIRRLSTVIVKDVIQSARSSAHETFGDKKQESREENHSEISDNLAESNQIDENGEPQNKNNSERLEDNPPEIIDDQMECKMNDKSSLEHTAKGNSDQFETISLDNQNKTNCKTAIVEDNLICGFGCFKPSWIQQYASPKVYLILFTIIGIIQGAYYPYTVSLISTLEKRYAFETKVSGTLLLGDEITPLIFGVIIGYIGGRTHRPRMVTLGMIIAAISCVISGLPYLIYGRAKHLSFIKYANETGPETCDVENKSGQCDTVDAPPTLTVVGIFLLASTLKGFATLSYYVIGVSYLDDNMKRKNSSLYLAITIALRMMGPLLGFLMSSAFLKIYEDPAHDPGYGPDDPRWIGAWWIGFFLQAVLLVIFSLPLALFPRRLPGQRRVEEIKFPGSKDDFKQLFLGLVSAVKRLATNPVFTLMIVNTTMKIYGHLGHSIMVPKYMENQFRLSASEANLYSGAISMVCVIVSTILGGYLIWIFKPRIRVLLGGLIASEAIMCTGFLILIIPRCQIVDMANFGMKDDGLILNSACNEMCDCSTNSYTPFCGPGGVTYFSPCFAGCTQETTISSTSSNKSKEFGNCSCIATSGDEQLVSTISEGVCADENCGSQVLIYLVIYYIQLTISSAFIVVHTMLLLRSVLPCDKCIALGAFETFIALFGFIPLDIFYGALVDSACLIWETNCDGTGNCWFYDMEKYSYLLHGVASLFCSLSCLCLIGMYFLSPRIRNMYVEEDDEKDYVEEDEERDYRVVIKLDTVSGPATTS